LRTALQARGAAAPGGEEIGAAVERLTEDGLGAIQTSAHARILGSLPGEQERDARALAGPQRMTGSPRRRVANACLKEKAKLSGSHRNVVISRGKTPALA
jgi:hypothetical protein